MRKRPGVAPAPPTRIVPCCPGCDHLAAAALVAPASFDRPHPLVGTFVVVEQPRPIGAVGPELAAAERAAAAHRLSAFGAPVAQSLKGQGRARRTSTADLPNPQRFTRHPDVDIALQLREARVGTDIAWPGAPGRPPPAGWDGEPGAASPHREL